MGKLEDIYPIAIEHTKQKVIQDIDRYLEVQDILPNFDTYLSDRLSPYLDQIWINVWLNKASNDVPRKEKKAFLKELGYETDGVDHKYINKIFRNELRNYRPFDVISWVKQTFSEDVLDWEQRYLDAREVFFKRQEDERIAKEKWQVRDMLQKSVDHLFEENSLLLYLQVRYHVAKKLADDFKNQTKYKYIDPHLLEERLVEQGRFDAAEYTWVTDFFEELTGHVHSFLDWGKRQFEYETYFDVYERFVFEYILDFAPNKIIEHLPAELFHDYYATYGEKLSDAVIKKVLRDTWDELAEACFDELEEENLADLLYIANIPFDEEIHKNIFEKDEADRERRKTEELEQQAIEKAEEERMIEDIFGKAYTSSLGKTYEICTPYWGDKYRKDSSSIAKNERS